MLSNFPIPFSRSVFTSAIVRANELGKAMNNMSEYLQYLTDKNNYFQNDNGIDLLGMRDGEWNAIFCCKMWTSLCFKEEYLVLDLL